jgi:fluoroacetyl-CoA thioesterase
MSDPAPSSFPGVRPGLRGEHEFVVTEAMTTAHIGGRRPVMTTPAMIMQMESTAQEVTRPVLDEDHTTVGFEVSIRHRAAVPVGGRVRIVAELLEVNGRRLLFKVEARQGDEVVGEGLHRRTIIGLGSLDHSRPATSSVTRTGSGTVSGRG